MLNYNYSDFDFVKSIALTYPETQESVSHEGTPSVKVRNKLMCRLHDSGEFIPIHLDFEIRDKYLDSYPEYFHLPDHFKEYKYICMWSNCKETDLMNEVLELSWKGLATKKMITEFEVLFKNNKNYCYDLL